MGDPGLRGEGKRGVARWTFADCCFDEPSWILRVAGQRVAIEAKPLEILRQLLLRAGQVVTKDELLDAVWPNVAVVEGSLPTAVRKLRLALRDDDRAEHIVETVPRIGYRISVPVERLGPPSASAPSRPIPRAHRLGRRAAAAAALVAVALTLSLFVFTHPEAEAAQALSHPTRTKVMTALRRMDVDRIQRFIDAGWDVNAPLDSERNTPFGTFIEQCEWNPGHDRGRMLLMTRTMLDGGADPTRRNVFGDTAYSIAKAKRFCGPDHPVTVMLRNLCYNGDVDRHWGDRCLASYELARRKKKGRRG